MGSMKRKQVAAENGPEGSLLEMMDRYPDERSCERRLMDARWPRGWPGIGAGLAGMPGLDQRRFDPADPDASLPTAHHVISNFKAWAQGTFHGISAPYLQAYAFEFSWRYSHRGADAFSALLSDCCGSRGRYFWLRRVLEPIAGAEPRPKRPRGRPRKHPDQRL